VGVRNGSGVIRSSLRVEKHFLSIFVVLSLRLSQRG
jgi:hypothetical protein